MKSETACASVRAASERDTREIADIYAHYVRSSSISFETAPPGAGEIEQRRCLVIQKGLPYLVAELYGRVVGYAYATPYRAREAYRYTVEDSIYVHPEYLGKGIGHVLMPALIEACERAGRRQMVAVIAGSENSASVRFHGKFDFRLCGTLRAVGFKQGCWVDTVLMQRVLGAGDATAPQN